MQIAVKPHSLSVRALKTLACSSFLFFSSVAHATAINPTKDTSLCLDVAGGSATNGSKVQVAHCYGDAAQNWSWVNGSLQVFGNKCLDVSAGNTTPGVTLQIWDCNGSAAQKWGVSGNSLVWTGGHLCADVPNDNVTDGQTVRTWGCNQSQAQSFNNLGASTVNTSSSFTGNIHPAGNTALCLDVAGGSTNNGTHVQIANCYGASDTAQNWNYTGSNLKVFGNKCLDVSAGNTTPGVTLQIWDCNGSAAQNFVQSGSSFVWKGGNLCIDVPNNNATDGQSVRTWSCNQSTAQTFKTPTSSTTTTTTTSTTSSSSGWKLVWSDEFNGTSLDRTKWNVEVNCDGGGNNEWQCYVDNPANISVANGVLSLNVIKQNYNGKSYTSGRINTSGKAHWTYGRFETRIKTPCGQGFWPAAWMLPEPNSYGAWPTSGELDIMEVLGGSGNKLYGTAHFGTPWPNQKQLGGNTTPAAGGNFCGSWHVYALEWNATQATWSVDGTNYFTLKNTDGNWSPLNHWPFDQNFFFILNNAMGGDWPGTPDGSIRSGAMQVDYVRAYSK